jgi:predicted transcriptional regulator
MSETRKPPITSSASTLCEETSFWTPAIGSKGTLTVEVLSLEDALDDFAGVLRDGSAGHPARFGFESYEALHKVLAPNRMVVVLNMIGAGPLSIREIARLVGRDFKGVHTDVTMLLINGLLDRAADGKVVFPYDAIHVDFRVRSGATAA